MKPSLKLPKGFGAFIITQSLGALNDNFFKILIQLYVLVILLATNSEKIIALATLVFTVPFVLFGPWAGYLADRFAKSKTMQILKFCEIIIMLIGVLAFYVQSITFLIFTLFLMASQSAFFSPVKASFIPETCNPKLISKANGIMGMTTFFSIIAGTALGGVLLSFFDNRVFIVSTFCIVLAIVGTITSFFITKTRVAGSCVKFPFNPILGIVKDLFFLKRQKKLFLTGLAHSYFWLLGLIFQTNILVYGTVHLKLGKNDTTWLSLLPAIMGIGIAVGSLLSSKLSGKEIKMGLVPIGGLGLAFSGVLLFFSTSSYWMTVSTLCFAGVSGGLYMIPLYSYLQFNSKKQETGRVLSTTGIMNGLFLVFGSVLYRLFTVEAGFSPAVIYLVMGVLTLIVTIYIYTVVPD